jgi:photosystem II stability/assembly factor-like uncharacterized protein
MRNIALLLIGFVAVYALYGTVNSVQREPVVYVPVVSSELFIVGAPNPQTGLFISHDNGVSWNHSGWKNIRAFGIAVDPSRNGDIIYIASGNGVLKTTDGGNSWRLMTDWRITEVMDIQVDRENVYIATAYGAFVSGDGGWTWTERVEGLTETFLSVILLDTSDPAIVYAGGEGGLFKSTDRGQNWKHVGFEGKPVRTIVQSPLDPDILYLGTEDDGIFKSEDRAETWKSVTNGIRHSTFYSLAIDPKDHSIIYASGFETGVYKTADGGRTWQRFFRGLDNLNIPALAIHPGRTSVVFAGTNGDGLYRSEDGGRTWRKAGLSGAEIYSIKVF